jgi:hypothetical protein
MSCPDEQEPPPSTRGSVQHEPLSVRIANVLAHWPAGEPLTLNRLLERTEGRGFYLVIILLALPFVVPVSIPGVSTLLGLTTACLALRLALGLPPRLPRFLGEREISLRFQKKVLGASIRILHFIEKLVKPRRTPWMHHPVVRSANAVLMAFMALLLALPFPPLPPFTNALPSYAIILLAASMMEEDGVTIWFAYAVMLGTIIYLVAIVGALQVGLVKVWNWLEERLGT